MVLKLKSVTGKRYLRIFGNDIYYLRFWILVYICLLLWVAAFLSLWYRWRRERELFWVFWTRERERKGRGWECMDEGKKWVTREWKVMRISRDILMDKYEGFFFSRILCVLFLSWRMLLMAARKNEMRKAEREFSLSLTKMYVCSRTVTLWVGNCQEVLWGLCLR